MTFKPTPEQSAIVEFAVHETDNLAVIARAGAAKTSTLILMAEALPETKILCLAFNAAIAKEMKERLPKNCESKTLHSLGFGAWAQFIKKRMDLKKNKIYGLVKEAYDDLHPDDREALRDLFFDTMDLVSQGKNAGWLPEDYAAKSPMHRPLLSDAEFFDSLPMDPDPAQIEIVKSVSVLSHKLALEGQIDFDDMVFCPAICSSVSWPKFPLTMIDEAQDLSPLNHHVLKKLVRGRRIIAVGDPCQAIYGFRGASENSMDLMINMFNMQSLSLTISFRCGKLITQNVLWRAPDMQSPDWAVEGKVERHPFWEIEQIQPDDAIICRNNAPLFSLAIKLLEHGKLPEIAGRDIAAPIIKLMEKLGKKSQLSAAALEGVKEWREKELKRARDGAKGNIHDKAQIMSIMLRQTKTLGDAIWLLKDLVSRPGRIKLMTGHKSKGLEFDRVWFLDADLCNLEQGQDRNVRYVIETRAKEYVGYINSKDLMGAED